jgi:hypothetical protein
MLDDTAAYVLVAQRRRSGRVRAELLSSIVWAVYRAKSNQPVTIPWRDRRPSPKGRLVVRLTLGGLVALTVLAAALSNRSAPLVIPVPKIYGAPGQRFEMSFLGNPTTCLLNGRCGVMPASPFPKDVLKTRFWSTDTASVTISTLISPMGPKAASSFVAANSPITGLPATEFQGHQAVRALEPCFSPDGTCTGYFGELDVITGTAMYSVFVSGLDKADSARLLATFHLVG